MALGWPLGVVTTSLARPARTVYPHNVSTVHPIPGDRERAGPSLATLGHLSAAACGSEDRPPVVVGLPWAWALSHELCLLLSAVLRTDFGSPLSGQVEGPQRLSRCPSITRLAQVRSPVSEAGRRSSRWPPLGTDASPQTGASCLSSSLILVPLYKVAHNATSLRMKSRV